MSSAPKFVVEFPADFKPTITQHPCYGQWAMMKSRCSNPNVKSYRRYGGRGIRVCSRWAVGEGGFTGFECFMMDVGPRPSKKHSLDRIDNNGDYKPGNCRWATNKEQANNRSSNNMVTYQGETLSMMDMAARHGMSYFVLRNRIMRKWTHEEAVETPFGDSPRAPDVAVGNRLPQTKLTPEKVAQIRELHAVGGLTMLEIGNRFGVSPANVCLIVNRKSWKHIKQSSDAEWA